MAKDPKTILKILSKYNGCVDNLYRYLYIPEFYEIAYNNIGLKSSQMTPASDGSTIDGISLERINKLIQSLRDRSYQPTPLRRVQISKKSGEKRIISIPSFEDKLVQEVIRMILEALYEHTFLDCSHGFRPGRSCHTALHRVKCKCSGTKWWINVDIKNCFDNINHQRMIQILADRIKEQKFLNLINKFLKAGYLENWQYHKTYSGIPQGSIISPILMNIYFDRLDKFITELSEKFRKGEKRSVNKKFHSLDNKYRRTLQRLKDGINVEKNIDRLKQQKAERDSFLRKNGDLENQDPNFRRMQYVRYADDFIVSIIASREEAEEVMNLIKEFLYKELKLELNIEKSRIVHNSEKIRFLGYDIIVQNSESRRHVNGVIGLYLPYELAVDLVIKNKFGKWVKDAETGKPKLVGIPLMSAINNDELEILNIYNTKIRGFYNYFKLATNVCKLDGFSEVIKMSFMRTLATKYKTSCAKLFLNKKYAKRSNGKGIVGITHNGFFYEYFDGPFNVNKFVERTAKIDIIENIAKYFARTSLINRLEAKRCELCGNDEGPFEVHHVRKLKDLKGKKEWEKHMIARKRKTMVLCKECHNKLHAGKL